MPPSERIWAAEVDKPGSGFAISREYALDHGLEGPEKYPSWPKYPDERDIPVGVAARAAWKVREARILASLASRKAEQTANNETANINTPNIGRCGHEVVRPERGPMPLWCSDACRMAFNRKKSKS